MIWLKYIYFVVRMFFLTGKQGRKFKEINVSLIYVIKQYMCADMNVQIICSTTSVHYIKYALLLECIQCNIHNKYALCNI